MKHIKVFLIPIIIIYFTLMFFSCAVDEKQNTIDGINHEKVTVELRAAAQCESATGSCTGGYVAKTITNILGILPYPNCPFSIEYKVRICPNGIDMIFISAGFIGSNPGCNQFDLDTNGPNASQIYDDIIRKLINYSIKVETFDFALRCPDTGQRTINFFQSSCTKRCLVEEELEEGGRILKIVSAPCGSGCCKTVLSTCFDENGVLQINVITPATPSANCPLQPSIPCPRGTIFEGTCRPSCLTVGTGG